MTQIKHSVLHYFQRLAVALIASTLFACHAPSQRLTTNEQENTDYSFNVMAPLILTNDTQWQGFEQELINAKQMGIDGVSVDIWWGLVEAQADQVFDWDYYHKIVRLLVKYELEWIPIMSFHQCGGNVGDDCNIPIPLWTWDELSEDNPNELMFKSEQGNYSNETLSFFQTDETKRKIYQQYFEFMQAFQDEFAEYSSIIQEINISMGPAGELRYPSYNSHDTNSGYPTRGAIQGASTQARIQFIETAGQSHIIDPEQLWTELSKIEDDGVFSHEKPGFSALLSDYLNWYHQQLVAHGKIMLITADKAFNDAFKTKVLGYKIPGIHWTIGSSGTMYRAAEIAAGLIPVSDYSTDNAMGYDNILALANSLPKQSKRNVIVHFTALEMSNNNSSPSFSMAKSLVAWLANGAQKRDIMIKGENALAAGVYSKQGWKNIDQALRLHYSGLTVLRIGDVANPDKNHLGHLKYQALISRVKSHGSL